MSAFQTTLNNPLIEIVDEQNSTEVSGYLVDGVFYSCDDFDFSLTIKPRIKPFPVGTLVGYGCLIYVRTSAINDRSWQYLDFDDPDSVTLINSTFITDAVIRSRPDEFKVIYNPEKATA